jgi:hypothetical protein
LNEDRKSYDYSQNVEVKLVLSSEIGDLFPPLGARFYQPAAPLVLPKCTTFICDGKVLSEPRLWRPRPPSPPATDDLTDDEFIEKIAKRKREIYEHML